jgi:uncharacterized protein (DUF1800 family)
MACAEGRKPDRSVISWRRMISMPILLISWRQLPTRPKLADPFDMSQLSEDAAVRRLGDRLGFGLPGNALIEAQQRRLTATLKQYLSPADGDSGAEQTPSPQLQWTPRPRNAAGGKPSAEEKKAWRQQMRQQRERLMLWWLDRMVRAVDQLRERMTWFWHGHFATSLRKARVASLMLGQNQTLRRLGLGDFQPLAQTMIIDPAMLSSFVIWDAISQVAGRLPLAITVAGCSPEYIVSG